MVLTFLDVPLVENATKVTFHLNGQPINNGQDFFSGRGAASDKTVNAAELVFIGYGTDAEYSQYQTLQVKYCYG